MTMAGVSLTVRYNGEDHTLTVPVQWPVPEKVLSAAIDMVVDSMKRNELPKMFSETEEEGK